MAASVEKRLKKVIPGCFKLPCPWYLHNNDPCKCKCVWIKTFNLRNLEKDAGMADGSLNSVSWDDVLPGKKLGRLKEMATLRCTLRDHGRRYHGLSASQLQECAWTAVREGTKSHKERAREKRKYNMDYTEEARDKDIQKLAKAIAKEKAKGKKGNGRVTKQVRSANLLRQLSQEVCFYTMLFTPCYCYCFRSRRRQPRNTSAWCRRALSD